MNKIKHLFTILILTIVGSSAFAQDVPEGEFDFMSELMGSIPIAIRELVSGASSIGMIIAGGVMLAFAYEMYKNIDSAEALLPNALKIMLGVVVLLMVWGASPIYGSISGYLNLGAKHPDAGRFVQVDLYYSVQRFSESLAKVLFPVMDEASIDEVAGKIEKKTNVLTFANQCNTDECYNKVKAFYAQNDRAPDSMEELYGSEMEEPSFGVTDIGAMLKYYFAKFINIGMIIQVFYFIFKFLLQIFLFMNNLFLTVIAQITLVIFMFTSFQVLSPRYQGNFIASVRSIATVSLFNFALNLVNGLTMTLLNSVDLTIGKSIAYIGSAGTSGIILKAVAMVTGIMVLYAISLKMIPAISQAITSGNLSYLNNLGEHLSNGVFAVGVAAAGAGLGAIPYIGAVAGGGLSRLYNSVRGRPGAGAGAAKSAFKSSFSGGTGPSGSPNSAFSGMGGAQRFSSFAGVGSTAQRPAALLGGGPSGGSGLQPPPSSAPAPSGPRMPPSGPSSSGGGGLAPMGGGLGTIAPKIKKNRKDGGSIDRVSFGTKDNSRSKAKFTDADFEHEEEAPQRRASKRKKPKAGASAKAKSGSKRKSGLDGFGAESTGQKANFRGPEQDSNNMDSDDTYFEEQSDRYSGNKKTYEEDDNFDASFEDIKGFASPNEDVLEADYEDITEASRIQDLHDLHKKKAKHAEDHLNKKSDKKTIGDLFAKDNLKAMGAAAAKIAGLGVASAFGAVRDTAFAGATNDYEQLGNLSVNPAQNLTVKARESLNGFSLQTHREVVAKKMAQIESEFNAIIESSDLSFDEIVTSVKQKFKHGNMVDVIAGKMKAKVDLGAEAKESVKKKRKSKKD